MKVRLSKEGQMMVRWSGECQVNLNLSLTLVDVKLVLFCFPGYFPMTGRPRNIPEKLRSESYQNI